MHKMLASSLASQIYEKGKLGQPEHLDLYMFTTFT